ncbi:Apolipoprotein L3 [Dissostichus eleginoides]|uniref:Apolipoprotein L3 n=1 Tax=Dissostichus eleginoides TaxID=100907 RepID=A0AAD9BP26_DISEL|nr:Apolipoprotein L3 [Dissostichus eleginoides]
MQMHEYRSEDPGERVLVHGERVPEGVLRQDCGGEEMKRTLKTEKLFRIRLVDVNGISLSVRTKVSSEGERLPAQQHVQETAQEETAQLETGQLETAQVETGLYLSGQVETGQVESAQVETAQVETGLYLSGLYLTTQVETAQVESAQVETAQVETAQVESAQVETAQVETAQEETAQITRPVPAPRRKVLPSDKSEDNEPENEPEKSPTRAERGVTPPPVAPKRWTIKKHAVENEYMEIVKVTETVNCRSQPPPLPPQRAPQLQQTAWTDLLRELKGAEETKIIKAQAENLYKAIQRFILLFSEHGKTLNKHTQELLCIADNLDKVSKGTKIAGITGGATSALGGVAAVAGVALAPFTAGASLLLTVAGAGVMAAGGITGASAAIAHKANVDQGKKKIDKTFEEFQQIMGKLQESLSFIQQGMDHLQRHDLPSLSEASQGGGRAASMVTLTASAGVRALALEAHSHASGLMEGLALGMDLQFAEKKQQKKKQKKKQVLESGLATKIRKLTEELNRGLDELYDLFKGYCAAE